MPESRCGVADFPSWDIPKTPSLRTRKLILHRHPHWKMLVLPALTFVLATAVAGFLLGLAQTRLDGTARTVSSIAVGIIWLGVVAWRSVAPFTVWKFTHFIVTDRRVLIRHGVLTHTGIDIPMGRISNVQFRHGLIDRMLKTGTLVIASASDDPLEFDDIPDVEHVHAPAVSPGFRFHAAATLAGTAVAVR